MSVAFALQAKLGMQAQAGRFVEAVVLAFWAVEEASVLEVASLFLLSVACGLRRSWAVRYLHPM